MKISIDVLQAILKEFLDHNLRVAVLHGLENFPRSHGRDIDLLVHPDDHLECRKLVCKALEKSGWQVKYNPLHIGIDHLFARLESASGSNYLELDLIYEHPFRWRGHEMLNCRFTSENLVSEHGFFVHPWGWFCKNILIQLLAGNFGKVRRNLPDLTARPEYFHQIRIEAEKRRYKKAASLILNYACEISEDNIDGSEALIRLREDVTCAVRSRMSKPHYWPVYILGMWQAAWRKILLTFPRHRGAPTIHCVSKNLPELEALITRFQKEQVNKLPFTNVNILPLSSRVRGLAAWIEYWLKDRSNSTALIATITYGGLGSSPYRTDLTVCLDSGSLSKVSAFKGGVPSAPSRREATPAVLAEWIGDAFMANLTEIECR